MKFERTGIVQLSGTDPGGGGRVDWVASHPT